MLVPRSLLFGGILMLASLGVYSSTGRCSTWRLYVVGGIGCALRVYDVPLVPAVLGLVLGPLTEQQFRRAMAISEGNVSVFLTRPISATLLVLAILALAGPLLLSRLAPSAKGVG